MNETIQIILGLIILAGVWVATRYGIGMKINKCAREVVAFLKSRGATSPASAVKTPFEKSDWLNIGVRDWRPKALEMLVGAQVVGRTEDGRYYLMRQDIPAAEGRPPKA